MIAAATTAADPIAALLNFGVLGLVAVLFITRRIITVGELDAARAATAAAEARAVAAETRERELERTVREEVVPAMVNVTNVASAILARQT